MEGDTKIKYKNPLAQAVFDEAMARIADSEKGLAALNQPWVSQSTLISIDDLITKKRLHDFLAAAEAAYRIECAGPVMPFDWGDTEPIPDLSEDIEKELSEAKQDIQELVTLIAHIDVDVLDKACGEGVGSNLYDRMLSKYSK